MTSINFAKLLADERKKAREASQANGGVKKTLPDLTLSNALDASDATELSKYKVGSIPTVHYIPNFVTPEESELILKHVYSHTNKWTKLKRRRLQNWGGIPSSRGMLLESLPLFLSEICKHLTRCKIFDTTPNHILLNEYARGQGIMSHKDGPLYFPRVAILSLSGPAVIHFRKELRDPPILSLYLQPLSLLIFQDDAYTSEELEHDEITPSLGNINSILQTISNENSNPPQSTTTTTTTTTSSTTTSTIAHNQEQNSPLGIVERGTRVSLTIRVVLNILNEDQSPANQAEQDELKRLETHWYNAINEVV